METTRIKTRWAKPNRTKVQDCLNGKMKLKNITTERKRQKFLAQVVEEANREYDIKRELGSKLSCLDAHYESPKFIDRLAEFAIVNIAGKDGDIEDTCITYIHEVDGAYYAIDVKSGEAYPLSMEKCRGKFKELVNKNCGHTWQEFFDEDKVEETEKIAYYDVPVREVLLNTKSIEESITPNISVADATNDIMNYILITDGLVHLNAYTDKSYYKK